MNNKKRTTDLTPGDKIVVPGSPTNEITVISVVPIRDHEQTVEKLRRVSIIVAHDPDPNWIIEATERDFSVLLTEESLPTIVLNSQVFQVRTV